MWKKVVLECIIIFTIIVVHCHGLSVGGMHQEQDLGTNEVKMNNISSQNSSAIEELFNLLNETLLNETLNLTRKNEVKPVVLETTSTESTETIGTSSPGNRLKEMSSTNINTPVQFDTDSLNVTGHLTLSLPPAKTLDDSFQETTTKVLLPLSTSSKSPLRFKLQLPSYAGVMSTGYVGQIIPPGEPWPADPPRHSPFLEDRFQESSTNATTPLPTSSKSPLQYKPQKPSFAGQMSSGQLGQIITPGKPWPADPPPPNLVLEDRFQESSTNATTPSTTRSESPLQYKPQRPSFAGQMSAGQLGQLIPPGKPWPTDPPPHNPVLEDRFQESSTNATTPLPTSSKSHLQYKPQRPSFAGQMSSGQLGQIIPPGKPWPADPPPPNPILEDRFQESSTNAITPLPTSSKSPLQYKPQRPSFAGQMSTGQLDQIIPPGKPWPADPPPPNPILEDRFQESSTNAITLLPTSSKSPLQYKPQRPSFAGQMSTGQLGQIILPGEPWPADPPPHNPVLEDRFQESSTNATIPLPTSSKSPLQYKPQRPSFAGQMSTGQLGQLIPPGKPWPADPPPHNPVLEDRFQESSTNATIPLPTSSKSPLQYKPQRPSFAGQMSTGQLGQLIPPGKPWPADPPPHNPVLEDRFQESSTNATTPLPTSSESPLQYKPQRPSFAGQMSAGQLGQLIPPGKPWPADPPPHNSVLEDRFQESSTNATTPLPTSSKSHLQYKPQRPSFAGQMSSGQLGQIIPPGKPWPADPPPPNPILEDRFQESSTNAITPLPTSSKSHLQYKPQRPSFAGQMSTGQLGQLIPPGKPWPADPPPHNPVLEDRFQESSTNATTPLPTSSESPLQYKPQRPSFAGQMSAGQLGQLIPPGKPWPADPPPHNSVLEDRFQESSTNATTPLPTSSKSPLQYKPQRPSFAGQMSTGQLGQIIPPGEPWPADPPPHNPVLEDRFQESSTNATIPLPTSSKSPLQYKPQRPSFAGQMSTGQLGQIIPPGEPWPADPPPHNPVLEDRFQESSTNATIPLPTSSKSPLQYKPQRPSFAGQMSTGQLGQLIPPGKPWPADPPPHNPVLEDRFQESSTNATTPLPTSSKSPLQYKPQRPSFTGQMSTGQLGQIIPPGKPWPADPPPHNPVLEDRFQESSTNATTPLPTSSKSPLQYKPQRPSFAGQMSTGQLGQLIPPGEPWPANPPAHDPILEDKFQDSSTIATTALRTSSKSNWAS